MKGVPYRPSWELPPLVWIRCDQCRDVVGSIDRIADRPGKITVYSYKHRSKSTTGHGRSGSLDDFDPAMAKVRCPDCGPLQLPENMRAEIEAGYSKTRTVRARPVSSM